jgi:Mg2+/Co2+ transporter CorC
VEIKIGVQRVSRELVLEVTQSAAQIEKAVNEALADQNGVFTLTDEHGRKVMIPSSKIGYIDIGEENGRRVGFGAV